MGVNRISMKKVRDLFELSEVTEVSGTAKE